ncbi:MAG: hypothetical protein VX132_01120 [Actinomycetota bacterium]|nr:hypothetical protein [Actinomycetota bacterium]
MKPKAHEQLIIVRYEDLKTKNSSRLPLISNDKIEEKLDQLETINAWLKRHDHQLTDINFYQTQIVRIYARGQTNKGGRFYRGWWQHVLSAVRRHILIDG